MRQQATAAATSALLADGQWIVIELCKMHASESKSLPSIARSPAGRPRLFALQLAGPLCDSRTKAGADLRQSKFELHWRR